MGRRAKAKAKFEYSEEEEEEGNKKKHKISNTSSFRFSDSDDEEANEDLSLKIVEKARLRAANMNDSKGEDIVTTELVASEIVKKEKKKKEKKKKKKEKEKEKKEKKKKKKADTDILMATPIKDEDKVDGTKDVEVVKLSEPDVVDNSNVDNDILRKLLRGPRYFDPPDKSWGACFNCGEDGHSAVNCTSARRKKPCFICGSLEHEVKQCEKGRDCYICKEGGHRAKDCPKKYKRGSQASELCLKCGATAHAMSSCYSDYSPDDLKEVQCYICKRFGHLCCVDYFDDLPVEASCYHCGESGHNGQECRGSRGETSTAGTPTSCYKCGEVGHFARECTNSSKSKKRTRDLSTPTRKHSKDTKYSKGYKSAPQDFGKTQKKRLQFDHESPNWSSKSKRRGGWIPDDYDLSPMNGWRSPATSHKKQKPYGSSARGQGSGSHSSRWSKFSSCSSSSKGYANGYQHRFSASRFGNSSSDGMRKNYDHW